MTTILPWSGFGTRISNANATVDDILFAAGLAWEVNVKPVYVKDDNGNFIPLKDHRALVRDEDDAVLDVTGTRFKPIQNEEAFTAFVDATAAGDMHIHTAGGLKSGRFVWGMADTKQVREIAPGDRLHGHLLMIQPHEHGKAFTVKYTIVRESNGTTHTFSVNRRFSSATWRMSHSSKFNDAKKADMKEVLGLTQRYMDEYVEKVTLLANAKWDEATTLRYLAQIFQPDLVEEEQVPATALDAATSDYANRRFKQVAELIHSYPGHDLSANDGTALGAYSVVTYALDHVLGRNADNRMHNAWLGQSGLQKARALDLAVEMAGGQAAPQVVAEAIALDVSGDEDENGAGE